MTDSRNGDQAHADFDVTSIVIDEYAECPPLEGLAEEAAEIERLLAELGGATGRPRPPGRELHERAVKDRLREWVKRDKQSTVLVWLGHGASDGTDAWLACYDTPEQIQGNGMVPQSVADQIIQDWHRRAQDESAWALVIVQACGAGTFVERMNQLAGQKVHPRRTVMVGVSGDSAGYVGELHKALKRTRDTYENNDEHILIFDFVTKLEEFLGDVAETHYRSIGRVSFRPMRLVGASLSAPVDVYREWTAFLAELSADERNHFVPKAHGAGHGEFAWHFIGRGAERKRVAAWLRTRTSGMLVVTGSPGCGKSALLGNLLVLTNPALRDLLVRTGRLAPPDRDEFPPDQVFDAVVHLAGMSTSDLVSRLAAAVEVTLPSAEHVWSEEDMDYLASRLAGRRFTLLVDALDEARDPVAIAGTVLSRLAQMPGVRVVVGTRTIVPGDPVPDGESLLMVLDSAQPAEVIRLIHDPEAIENYVHQRLRDARSTQRIDVDDDVIDVVARRLAHGDEGDRQFLFARLAVHELITQPEVLDPSNRPSLEVFLNGNHRSLFAFVVGRLTKASRAARPLLEALALAQGRGIPRSEGIWAQMATALAGSRIGEQDIEDLLTRAGPYIMLDAEYEVSVYRLAHEAFRELLQPGADQISAMENGLSKPREGDMSDGDLGARLDHIQAELQNLSSAVGRVIATTRSNSDMIDAVERNLGSKLGSLDATQRRMNDKIDSLDDAFAEFVEQDRRDKQRLFAYAGLLSVRSEIETKYGQYEDVRRNVHGMLLALDGGLAQDATMQLIAETQSINAPSYWLASAMNALAAWIRDDQSAAERALLHSSSCSRPRTALFFGLLNARYGRFGATDNWFREYLNDQDPEALSQEFTVVLDAAMLGLLGDTTYDRVNRQCQAWFERLAEREEVVAQQVVRWRQEITRHCEPEFGSDDIAIDQQCPVLASLSPDWRRITTLYRQATAFTRMQSALSRKLDPPYAADQSAWQARIDEILDGLQKIHEPGEAGLRLREADYERIIGYNGDITAADSAKAAEAPRDEPLVDLLTFLTNSASHPPPDAPRETTQLALHLASPWISQAVAGIVSETRKLSAAPVKIEIDGWSGQLGTESVERLADAFTETIAAQTAEKVKRVRRARPRLIALVVDAVVVGLIVGEVIESGTFQLWPAGLLAFLAVIVSVFAVVAHRRIPQRVKDAKRQGEKRATDGVAALLDAEADRAQLLAACSDRIAEADLLDEFLGSIEVPDLRREASGQRWEKGVTSTDPDAENLVTSPRPRGTGRLQTPFKLAKWSLEPVGTDTS